MRRRRVLSVLILGTIGVSLLALAAVSSALPEALSTTKETIKGLKLATPLSKSSIELSILSGFGNTKCTESEAEMEAEGTELSGRFHTHLLGCTTNFGGECVGLGETAKSILVLGSFHFVYDTLSSLGVAILYSLAHLHYTCIVAGVEKLILVTGKALCLVSPINSLSAHLELKCLGASGDPKETRYWNDSGTEVNVSEGLLASENEGVSYKMAAQQSSSKLECKEGEVEIMG